MGEDHNYFDRLFKVNDRGFLKEIPERGIVNIDNSPKIFSKAPRYNQKSNLPLFRNEDSSKLSSEI